MNMAQTHTPVPNLQQRFPERLVQLADGAQLAIRECGQGPVVVLLHGIGSGSASWLHCAQRLAAGNRVIAWDAPGYGLSTPLPPARPKACDYAACLELLLDALGVESCLLVGHSLGALMATAYAAGIGAARVRRLVLLSPVIARMLRQKNCANCCAHRRKTAARLSLSTMKQNISGKIRWAQTERKSATATRAGCCSARIDGGSTERPALRRERFYCNLARSSSAQARAKVGSPSSLCSLALTTIHRAPAGLAAHRRYSLPAEPPSSSSTL